MDDIKTLIFRTDRLGDFIIHSRPIYELKIKYPNSHITVVCSDLNKKVISKYSFIDELIIHNKKDKFFIKFKNFLKIIKKKYYAAFIIDGKKFSHICNIFIRSKNKLGLVYTSQKKFFMFKYLVQNPFHFYNLIFFNKSSPKVPVDEIRTSGFGSTFDSIIDDLILNN